MNRTRRAGRLLLVVMALGLLAVPGVPAAADHAGTTTRVNVTGAGTEANGFSSSSDITADGRYVAFISQASNLVPGDTNGEADVFVRDNVTGSVDRVSVHSDGTQSNAGSFFPSISADGARVSFSSHASNLVDNDTNGQGPTDHDVFVHDRGTGATVRVNVSSDGSEATDSGGFIASSISGDGRFVSFSSVAPNLVPNDTNGFDDVFVHDLDTATTTRVSVASTVPPAPAVEGHGVSFGSSISFDGRFVAFESLAPNLVVGDTNLAYDVFVHDRITAATTRVSVASDGAEASVSRNETSEAGTVPAISADGTTVAFRSGATNLVPGDTNGRMDVFVHHRPTATTTRVSVRSDGTEADAHSGYSGDFRFRSADVSNDGSAIAFRSEATNLVAADNNGSEDVFVHRRQTAATTRVSVSSGGTQADAASDMPAISGDGRHVAFASEASNLVTGDTNGKRDIFVHDSLGAVHPPADAVADFDGDGDTDRSVFRAGAWYADGQETAYFGNAGDIAVPGDYNGTGRIDRAVYRQGAWLTEGQPTDYLGVADDVPVPADYDGDGTTDRAVYRPSVGAWYIDGQAPIFHGASGDIPVPGDYDGDGDAEVGIFRPSVGGWYIAGQTTRFIGYQGDIPVPGDYNGDRTGDRAVFRPSVGGWYIDGQATQFIGLGGDVPVPGDYDGNGATQVGIWRPSVGGWHIDGQAPAYLGAQGDTPLPLPAAIHRAFFSEVQ